MASGASLWNTGIKLNNAIQVLRLIQDTDQTTKPEIARQLGLSLPTASQLVDEWVELGYLRFSGVGDSTHLGGKRPRLVSFNPIGRYIIALHIGVDRVIGALTDMAATISFRVERHFTADETRETLADKVLSIARSVLDEANAAGIGLIGIGITMPGIVDPSNGTSRWATHRAAMNGLAVRDLLQPLHLPVWIDNECRGVALAEKWFGAGKSRNHFISLYTDSGIGAGFVINGDIVRGEDYSFGEVGHMTIRWDGPLCACGNSGCWELYASSRALLRMMEERLEETAQLREWVERGEPLTVALIAKAIRTGDNSARMIAIDEFSAYMGAGIVSLIHMCNPECVILYGQICRLGEELLHAIRRYVSSRGLSIPISRVLIEFSRFEEEGDLVGAAALAWEEALKQPETLFRN